MIDHNWTPEKNHTLQFIEDVEAKNAPLATEAILTDEALERGGLVKIEAFVRTKTSAAAARKAKQRETQEAAGLKQINITAPEEVQEKIKAIAKACTAGQSFETAVQSVTSHALVTGWKGILVKVLTTLLTWLQHPKKTA